LCVDPHVTLYLHSDEARALLDARAYVGDAPQRAKRIASRIKVLD
jgi:hypothetical protein